MAEYASKKLIVICGPTAVGKTKAAIEVALHFNTHIISADSRQFFKEMNIGTAKPSADELAMVSHHFVGHLSIHDFYTPGDFERDAIQKLDDLFKNHKTVVMVGGSGLYIQAVCEGIDNIPTVDISIRNFLNQKYEYQGLAPLLEQLKWLDSEYYFKVDRNNPQRIIRALEVCLGTGKPFSSFHHQTKVQRNFTVYKIGLNLPREILYSQINHRVDAMIQAGLENEARGLWPHKHINALQTVGYSEFFDYFEGKTDFETAIELIKQHTRNYAKRQISWFNRDKEVIWCHPNDCLKQINELIADV